MFGQQKFGWQTFSQKEFGQEPFGQQMTGWQTFGWQTFGWQAFSQKAFGLQTFGWPMFGRQTVGQQRFGWQNLKKRIVNQFECCNNHNHGFVDQTLCRRNDKLTAASAECLSTKRRGTAKSFFYANETWQTRRCWSPPGFCCLRRSGAGRSPGRSLLEPVGRLSVFEASVVRNVVRIRPVVRKWSHLGREY